MTKFYLIARLAMMRPPLLIKNALRVATMDDAGTELAGADILIKGRVILAVGKDLEAPDDAQVLDARGCVVIPGMVNTHHHLCQTLTRATPAAQDAKLFDWLVYHYQVWRHLTPEYAALGAQVGLGELLLTGCTTSTDHTYLYPRGLTGLVDAQIDAARSLGIRFAPTRGSMSVGVSKGGLPPDDCTESEEEILRDGERLIKEHHDKGPYAMIQIGLAPCAPFSVSTDLMKQTAAQAKKWGVRMHTHLCETLDEEAYCLEKYKLRPIDFLESLGWMNDNVWLAHMVHVNDDEIRRLAEAKVGIAHCPSSNLRLGSGVPPVRKYLDAGVNVGLAVDGSASNDTSDMLGEARQAMLVHRVKSGVGSMTARQVLRMATRGGAAALGRDDLGQIAPGKAADLAIFDVNRLDYAGSAGDPVASLLFCGAGHRTRWTIVNGHIVVENGTLKNLDEGDITRQANAACLDLLKKAGAVA
ncbi:MAG: 8-oxoguanine deaminase [Elusimicrobiota bacterium]|nr:8-oxoguanine deaminase [Elusimicrobiota bacterium]